MNERNLTRRRAVGAVLGGVGVVLVGGTVGPSPTAAAAGPITTARPRASPVTGSISIPQHVIAAAMRSDRAPMSPIFAAPVIYFDAEGREHELGPKGVDLLAFLDACVVGLSGTAAEWAEGLVALRRRMPEALARRPREEQVGIEHMLDLVIHVRLKVEDAFATLEAYRTLADEAGLELWGREAHVVFRPA